MLTQISYLFFNINGVRIKIKYNTVAPINLHSWLVH